MTIGAEPHHDEAIGGNGEQAVDWTPPKKGHWRRDFRLGEWLPAPVSTSWERWYLPQHEEGFRSATRDEWGVDMVPPLHVIVHGWYFTNDHGAKGMLGAIIRRPGQYLPLFTAIPRMFSAPEKMEAAQAIPGLRAYDGDLHPAHLALVDRAESQVATATLDELVLMVDGLARSTGTLMTSLVTAAGFASKAEAALASFYAKRLRPLIGGSHLVLLAGLVAPTPPPPHGVTSIDWIEPTFGEIGVAPRTSLHDHAALAERRADAETSCRRALAGSSKRVARFGRTLEIAQRWIPERERLTNDFTSAWPVMRRALYRLGEHLLDVGVIADAEDIFHLERSEVVAAIAGDDAALALTVERRKAERAASATLNPPLGIGPLSTNFKMAERMIAKYRSDPIDEVAVAAADGLGPVVGTPASAGVATGRVRIVRGPEDFAQVDEGDVLVAPVTAPGWEPIMALASAVVTDSGSAFAHASVIAREFGIPAVVGTGDGTARLADADVVTVDGDRGMVTRVG